MARVRKRSTLAVLLVAVGFALILLPGCGGSNDGPAAPAAGQRERLTESKPESRLAGAPRRPERRGERPADTARSNARRVTSGERPPSAARRGNGRVDKPKKGEVVVPDKPQCTGPDVFDEPGCESVIQR